MGFGNSNIGSIVAGRYPGHLRGEFLVMRLRNLRTDRLNDWNDPG
jgi:hypothetical protein